MHDRGENHKMTRMRKFMTAEWKNLLMLNYAVNSSLLQSFVPSGTELDAFEGKTYLSLVGFEFNRSRVFGLTIPFHQAFEEVNLRFYVKRSSKRGVVFIRELVPKFAVAAVARVAYKENYLCVPMSHRIETQAEGQIASAEYAWGSGQDRCSMRIETGGASYLPTDRSLSQFITEHYWGYAVQPDGGSLEYEVQHPRWCVRNSKRAVFSGDATGIYGAEFAQVLTRVPDSAFMADGSPVTIFKGSRIE
jgi:uncharacterized protein YqjF (DUF2071 family)